MAQFSTIHKELEIGNMRFRGGMYNTNDKQEIEVLSRADISGRYQIIRLDAPEKQEAPIHDSAREQLVKSAVSKAKQTNKK